MTTETPHPSSDDDVAADPQGVTGPADDAAVGADAEQAVEQDDDVVPDADGDGVSEPPG